MSIKQHLQTALSNIRNDKEKAIAIAKDRAMREEIIPRHGEINKARDEAIAKITETQNRKMAQIQESYNAEKQQIVEAAEKKKTEVTNSILECAVATETVKYEKIISTLEEQISKAEE